MSAVKYRLQQPADMNFLIGRGLGSLLFGFLLGYLVWRVTNRRSPVRSGFSTVYFIAGGVIVATAFLPS